MPFKRSAWAKTGWLSGNRDVASDVKFGRKILVDPEIEVGLEKEVRPKIEVCREIKVGREIEDYAERLDDAKPVNVDEEEEELKLLHHYFNY